MITTTIIHTEPL